MSNDEVIKAWKDPEFRSGLGKPELAALPSNPAGMVELADADLFLVLGAGDRPEPDTFSVITSIIGSIASVTYIFQTINSGCETVCGTCPVGTQGCC